MPNFDRNIFTTPFTTQKSPSKLIERLSFTKSDSQVIFNYLCSMQAKVNARKCKVCGEKYTPRYRTTDPCPNIECRVQLFNKNIDKIRAKNLTELKAKVKTHSDWKRDLQVVINSIVRALDKETCCISSLRPLNPKFDAGHRWASGGNANITFNLLNIYAQSVHDNQHKSGNPDGFDHGLKSVYGIELYNEVHNLKLAYHGLIVSTEMIKTALPIAKSILKAVIAENKVYDPAERILKRKQFNKMISIYTN